MLTTFAKITNVTSPIHVAKAMVSTMSVADKLTELRRHMAVKGVAAYLIPTSDPHQSEYVAETHKRRDFISEFTGSAGFAVVTATDARLWTDGRYFLQAETELDAAHWTLMKQLPGADTPEKWLAKTLPAAASVGVDPAVLSATQANSFKSALTQQKLVAVTPNLVDLVWGEAKPPMPYEPVMVHPESFAGEPVSSKLAGIRDSMKKEGCKFLPLCALDHLAWLYNIRGSDIECNPVAICYGLLTDSEAFIYIDSKQVTQEATEHFKRNNIVVKGYEDAIPHMKSLSGSGKWWVAPGQTTFAVVEAIGSNTVQKMSPIAIPKAIKNEKERDGMRNCHIRDGVALVKYLHWLEEEINAGRKVTECSGSDRLEQFRREQRDFISLSFPTISGSGPNGAIIHYRPIPGKDAEITKDKVYLCDSGAQYRDGTTDVTRTVHLGTPTAHEKECFTRVLKGHIALDSLVFPRHTAGSVIDAFARQSLWQVGLDYRHGTGHGVGAFLNVHEGPHLISFRKVPDEVGLDEHFTVTIEPGFYEDGNFGIRIENVCLVKKANTKHNFGGTQFFTFEHITWAPISKKLVDVDLLNDQELMWLNDYHAECQLKLSPGLEGTALAWLKDQCSPLKRA